ncbi:zinc transporter permease [Microbacterium sp. SYP-A9085]|uniref:zinc transporter permease n=1 Tax=Microbacterium sp. SYP-A9085 TaxID=2664454 RepID=UPI00129BD45E|nr:zinc transporter permease [Microbacterium sp. SYP-A9085]MRH30137.1 zinc transporter permease [Microbacterium sp. SYP-A9085]
MSDQTQHETHHTVAEHEHGPGCGHDMIQHGDHVDYVHDGHRHALHGDHYDEHEG